MKILLLKDEAEALKLSTQIINRQNFQIIQFYNFEKETFIPVIPENKETPAKSASLDKTGIQKGRKWQNGRQRQKAFPRIALDHKLLIEMLILNNFNPIVLSKLADHFFRNCIILSVFCPKEMNGS